MVGRSVQGGGRSFFNELKSSASIDWAARAIVAGVQDPVAFLSYADLELTVACIAVEKAITIQSEMRRDEWNAVIKNLSNEIGNVVARQLGNLFR